MSEHKIQRALISVYDKTGVVDFARALHSEFGIEILSTGGTAKLLRESGLPVKLVEDVTGFPELLDGRVKTLHPRIHAGLLADRDNPEHVRQLAAQGIAPIDMVVVNLYPFEKTVSDPSCTFEQAIEMIDIGGPCLLRAAAKNHQHVLVVSDPQQYTHVRLMLRGSAEALARLRRQLAVAAFAVTRAYDARVHDYLEGQAPRPQSQPSPPPATPLPPHWVWSLEQQASLRYGENPHQSAGLYREESMRRGLTSVPGKLATQPASYNNYVDADAAFELCRELTHELGAGDRGLGTGRQPPAPSPRPPTVCVFIKHTNPCGVGLAADPIEAYRRAYLGDPHAAMGGILACNFEITPEFAAVVMDTFERWGKPAGAGGFFVEVWVAPHFHKDALRVIETAKPWGERVRLLVDKDIISNASEDGLDCRRIKGGLLVQTRDRVGLAEDQWNWVSSRRPTEPEMADLRLAWLIGKHTKSNAITICKDGMLLGNGAGQMSRVMSCRVATWLARENGHADKLPGAVAASDAFFPFPDGPEILMDAGVTAIVQPGGSKRDGEVLAACNHRDVAMIFTDIRHFKH
ncbi:MAG TPA: bifunctional phosphoribosylaminoimidazolecarboxamide formyltransferase/IMP cyclohydrolase [Phycisphaerae bacterium]|jgi:phosphoribosylaminoimidazolecarboxamide formyltransferase/IMP cyclohydrolase